MLESQRLSHFRKIDGKQSGFDPARGFGFDFALNLFTSTLCVVLIQHYFFRGTYIPSRLIILIIIIIVLTVCEALC